MQAMNGTSGSMAIRVGLACLLVLFAAHAEAVSSKHIDRFQPTGVAEHRIGFFLGEDGGIWYTVIDRGGLSGTLTTGNEMNPFDSARSREAPNDCSATTLSGCSGFVSSSTLSRACLDTGDICDGIYARTPGPGLFLDTVTTDVGSPICHTQLNIIATGLDNNFWYTLFDIGGGVAGGIGGGSGGGGVCPGMDPFATVSEDQNETFTAGGGTGFVNQTSLSRRCTQLSQICVGPWVAFP